MAKEACIFDIGNVLINFDLESLLQRIARDSGSPLSQVRNGWKSAQLVAVETGKIEGPAFFKSYSEMYGLNWSYDNWIDAWADIYTLNESGIQLLLNLKQKGHQVYLLSNLAVYNQIAIERKFRDFFSHPTANFFSYELGFHKPDPAIYRAVCDRMNRSPQTCIFLDDMPENVHGAKSVGMHGIEFCTRNIDQIIAAINAFVAS